MNAYKYTHIQCTLNILGKNMFTTIVNFMSTEKYQNRNNKVLIEQLLNYSQSSYIEIKRSLWHHLYSVQHCRLLICIKNALIFSFSDCLWNCPLI